MKLVANSVTKTTTWFPFLLLSSTVHQIREKSFQGAQSEIKIRETVFPAKLEKSKIRAIKRPRKFYATRYRFSDRGWILSYFLSILGYKYPYQYS